MDSFTAPPPGLCQREPTIAELLARCDFARLHPERLAQLCQKHQLQAPSKALKDE